MNTERCGRAFHWFDVGAHRSGRRALAVPGTLPAWPRAQRETGRPGLPGAPGTSWVIGIDQAFLNSLEGSLQKRDDRAMAARILGNSRRRSASCESESPRTRTGNPSGRGFRSGERPRPRSTRRFRSCDVNGRRNRSNTVRQSVANCSHGGACPSGNDGNEPFDRTDGGLDRYGRTRQGAEIDRVPPPNPLR